MHIGQIEKDDEGYKNPYARRPQHGCQNKRRAQKAPARIHIEINELGIVFHFKDHAVHDKYDGQSYNEYGLKGSVKCGSTGQHSSGSS